jgi:uncharacterized damage-inducible protein DinB
MGKAVLEVPTGGERHKTVADLIKHIFAAEIRYIQRFKGESLTPYNQIPSDNAEELFDFGYESRAVFKEFVNKPRDWTQSYEFSILDFQIKAPVRKFIIHVLIHEVRHWAQVALLLRQAGYEDLGDHDFIISEG